MTLASHLGNFTSLIIIVLRKFSTSSWMIWFVWGTNFLLFWSIGLKEGSMLSLGVIIFLSIPVIYSCFQENVLLLSFRNFISSCWICYCSEDPIKDLASASLRFTTLPLHPAHFLLTHIVPLALIVIIVVVLLKISSKSCSIPWILVSHLWSLLLPMEWAFWHIDGM